MADGLLTKLTVTQIQQGIIRAHGTNTVVAVPNVSWGFFRSKGIECDLLVETDCGVLHEFEIKRSWSDFLADFKKKNFHNDVRLMKLTFVLPIALAGDKLRTWCADNYQTFRRTFDFWFYDEYARMFRPTMLNHGGPYSTEYYLTDEMRQYIDSHDPDYNYSSHLFTEERANLYRLGCIRLWSNPPREPMPEIPPDLHFIPRENY